MTLFANLLFAAMLAPSFNSAEWLEKRAVLTREAERLQAVYAECAAKITDPATDVVVPIETFSDGSIRSEIRAKKAMYFFNEGYIWAEDVMVFRYDETRKVVSQIDAKNMVIDRVTKSGWADGPAVVRHESTKFEGEGIYFSSMEGYLMSLKGAKITAESLKFGGAF